MKFSRACKLVRKDFALTEDNKPIISLLTKYAKRDIRFENETFGRYLDKGIFLWGQVGTGKTTLIKALQKYYQATKNVFYFNSVNIRNIAYDFSVDGFASFNKYSSKNWLFDELGTDKEQGQFFGKKEDVFERILLDRYDAFCNAGYLSHFTTNLSPTEIRERYGERHYSRLLEMCNFIEVQGADFRAFSKPKKSLLEEEVAENIKYANILIERMKYIKNYGMLGSFSGLFNFDDYYNIIDKAGFINFSNEDKNKLIAEQRLFLINSKKRENKLIEKKDDFKEFVQIYEENLRPNLKNRFDLMTINTCKMYVFKESLLELMQKNENYEQIIIEVFDKYFKEKTTF